LITCAIGSITSGCTGYTTCWGTSTGAYLTLDGSIKAFVCLGGSETILDTFDGLVEKSRLSFE
jgi:hypothetical protein